MFRSGERLPFLCVRDTGVPLFEPTLYALTELRATNKASATIEQALRAVMVLHLALDQLGVDLARRLDDGRLLELGELEQVARQCRLTLSSIEDETPRAPSGSVRRIGPERARSSGQQSSSVSEVDAETVALRLHYIRHYLRWRSTSQLLKFGPQHSGYSGLASASEIVLSALKERTPTTARRGHGTVREGLAADAQRRLLAVIDPDSPDNPWKGRHAQVRNQLMVRWLHDLGVRRGELLGVRVSDINFQSNEVVITRHADDSVDPRRQQPNTKTNARLLMLDEELTELTRKYVMAERRAIRGARRHEFLFVANGSGAPLTMAALNKVFVTLRARVPELPKDLSPHVLRHTWNDKFSELMDAKRVPEETEKKLRATLMGWSENSPTASIYTRRHIRRRAQEASIDLQRQMKKVPMK